MSVARSQRQETNLHKHHECCEIVLNCVETNLHSHHECCEIALNYASSFLLLTSLGNLSVEVTTVSLSTKQERTISITLIFTKERSLNQNKPRARSKSSIVRRITNTPCFVSRPLSSVPFRLPDAHRSSNATSSACRTSTHRSTRTSSRRFSLFSDTHSRTLTGCL
jgi:hypothetical protein